MSLVLRLQVLSCIEGAQILEAVIYGAMQLWKEPLLLY